MNPNQPALLDPPPGQLPQSVVQTARILFQVEPLMADRRVGVWLIGAYGGVGCTTAVGVSALAQGLSAPIGMVTALPQFSHVPFDTPSQFVLGGHDVREGSFLNSAKELQERSGVFSEALLRAVETDLNAWAGNVKPGVIYKPSDAVAKLTEGAFAVLATTPRDAISRVQADLKNFQKEHTLDQVVVVNVASTEPVAVAHAAHATLAELNKALDRGEAVLPSSSLSAYAALDAGMPYLNITPSCGASLPAMIELAATRGVPHAGQDLKTGETLLKSVLAPLFAKRNLKVLSWVGHNILGNRDGQVLADPANKASKVKSKDALLAELLGYKPQSLVSIEYVESLDDWKTAWDHVHFEGFLGTKMTLQFTWQGCDSLLAAPLVIDLARILFLAQRRGQSGAIGELASFFKSPLNGREHDFALQFQGLLQYLSE